MDQGVIQNMKTLYKGIVAKISYGRDWFIDILKKKKKDTARRNLWNISCVELDQRRDIKEILADNTTWKWRRIPWYRY
jgi:hypothetical protein